jgi:hypothetical protein
MSHNRKLNGLAFEVDDLLAIQAWAKRNRIRMDIRLDHGVGDEQYEEFIAFHSDATPCFLLLWRDENVVFAQPMPGRRLRFPSVFAALSRLHVKQGVAPAS